MKDLSDQSPDRSVNTAGVVSPDLGAGGSRRRFIKGGAAAAPVILTFTSRPVLGFEQACMTPSRMISGNHSGFAGPATCAGNTRAFWASQANLPQSQQPGWVDQFFTDVFGADNPYESTLSADPKKLGAVLLDSIAERDANTNAPKGFASYIIAAYLNALNVPSVTAVLKPAQVIHMWNDVVGKAEFCPQLMMCWNGTGVIGYLTNSGIVPA